MWPIRRTRPSLDDRAWSEYLFYRDNPRGWFCERWFHTAGCRQWFVVERHTVTDEIAGPLGRISPPDGEPDESASAPRRVADRPVAAGHPRRRRCAGRGLRR
ncbi:MAG: sarcosine oxidase subunit delta [Nocardioidaceae bacterium]